MKKSDKILDIVSLCLITLSIIASLMQLYDGNYAKANNDLLWAVLLSVPFYAPAKEDRE